MPASPGRGTNPCLGAGTSRLVRTATKSSPAYDVPRTVVAPNDRTSAATGRRAATRQDRAASGSPPRPSRPAARRSARRTCPALLRAVVLVGAHVAALLEVHLGAPVADVGEDDGDELVAGLAGSVGDREHEALGRSHLVVLADPADLAAVGAAEHRRPPGSAWTHVHRDGRERHLALDAAEPVREAVGLGPLPPDALARGGEDPRGREAAGAEGRRLSHLLAVARPCDRTQPPRTRGSHRATRPHPSWRPRAGARGAAAPCAAVRSGLRARARAGACRPPGR